jgi:hypothetical protein
MKQKPEVQYDIVRYRTALGFQKSKRYLSWMKERNPNLDLHHILGSVHGKKFTDYLVVAIDHAHHLNVVEPHKGMWFDKYLLESLENLQIYVNEILEVSFIDILNLLPDFEPESIRNFIIAVHAKDIK